MREVNGNLFEPEQLGLGNFDAICITTNGYVRKDGCAVMGRGCAKAAADKWPYFPRLLGAQIRNFGNSPIVLTIDQRYAVVTFPVKPILVKYCKEVDHLVMEKYKSKFANDGRFVPGWACKADFDLIDRSASRIRKLTDRMGWQRVVTVRPGCGNGELDWAAVKPMLEKHFDDRFYVITFGRREYAPRQE
jgi:hypothetical protein